ncbi:uncharacterized protein LOC122512308 isoform X2 [Leptopilina heterotoma]|uniref:uncharacterized protein LOC122512308 isoform X2 n=1 Tax=Leptopilina heterotoma TaxID=63436 RepID=UPI001CAA3985|nr:uncharacterized protein LOC122512308 isoform X2 [Leptopilina heterotoma]
MHPDLNDAKTCSKDLFDKIDRNESCINLPKSWNKINIVWRSQRGIVFLDRIGIKGENGRIDSVSTKEVTIDEEMTLLIKIHGKVLNHTDLNIENEEIHSTEELEAIIQVIHDL